MSSQNGWSCLAECGLEEEDLTAIDGEGEAADTQDAAQVAAENADLSKQLEEAKAKVGAAKPRLRPVPRSGAPFQSACTHAPAAPCSPSRE